MQKGGCNAPLLPCLDLGVPCWEGLGIVTFLYELSWLLRGWICIGCCAPPPAAIDRPHDGFRMGGTSRKKASGNQGKESNRASSK